MLLDLNLDLVSDLSLCPSPKMLGQESIINSVTADVWWQWMERQEAIHGDLCILALKLLSMPAGSAAIERFFFLQILV